MSVREVGCCGGSAAGPANSKQECCRKKSPKNLTCDLPVDDDTECPDQTTVYDHIRTINDPEFPQTLEDLKVVRQEHVAVDQESGRIHVRFTPTIPHCSMATLIGLSIRVRLLRRISPKFKVCVEIADGTHVNEKSINKQLDDKERVAAALENQNLLGVINQCLDEPE